MRHWRGEFWTWNQGRYRRLTEHEFSAMLTKAIKHHIDAVPLTNQHGNKYQVTKGLVSNVRNALASEVLVPETLDQPVWLGDENHADFLAMERSVELRGRFSDTTRLRSHDPEWFSGGVWLGWSTRDILAGEACAIEDDSVPVEA